MRNLMISIAVLFAGSVYAQDYTFKVLISKGQNTVKSGKEWLPVKVGASLKSVDVLQISPNGYVGLVHVSGKPLEVKEAGSHKVADLAGQVKASTSVLNKYTDFILSTVAEQGTNLNATGAVQRGNEEIKLYLPEAKKAVVLNNEMILTWTPQGNTSGYRVQFSSMFGDELKTFEVTDTSLVIDLNAPEFIQEDNIVGKVFSKDSKSIDSEEFVIKKLSAADKQRLSASLDEVKGLVAEKTALNQFYLANFYEENKLLIDAATAYLNAIRLAPGVPDFKIAFDQFVVRNAVRN